MENIRNFVIIAHIDHGKSTLADRFLEITGTVEKRKMREQFLDMHPLEREKGITIKMAPVRMVYRGYILNLIDTPGHVDFSYEVSRALAAVEGAILLVDSTQGVQAQTLANLHLAQKEGLQIIPVVNKIDLPSAEIAKTEEEILTLFGDGTGEILKISGKTGKGVEELLRLVVDRVPPPNAKFSAEGGKRFPPKANPPSGENIETSKDAPLRALIFDSLFDSYQGVVAYVRIFEGRVKRGEKIKFLATGAEVESIEVGIFSPERVPKDFLEAGEIGYIATGIKESELIRVGDTITHAKFERLNGLSVQPLSGYREPEPMVFASIFPENQDEYEILRESLKKLKLNDASLLFQPEESGVLGRGYRTGFLGMLHMEIAAERLRREYGLNIIFSNPSVSFRVRLKSGGYEEIYSASKLPDLSKVDFIEEPWIAVEIISPGRFLGALNSLIHERGGEIIDTATISGERMLIKFEAPLREIIVDFYDRLKSITEGFGSMSYELADYRRADLVRFEILVAGEKVPHFSEIVPRSRAYFIGRERVLKLKELLPRELFSIALQAEVEGRIIARETLPALKKDVTGYLYGGDRTRKMKLWKKQQRGKKKLKEMGQVEIPAEVFLKMLRK